MDYFYDLKQKAFLVDGLHQDIPEDAISVTENDFKYLIDGRNKGKEIVVTNGYLTLTSVRPTSAHEWNGQEWVLTDDKRLALLESQRQQAREAINALRDKKINGGVYVPAIDKWIDTDATAERNILSVKATLDLFGDQEIPWTFADNSVAMINKEKLLVIWQVLMEAKTGNHANALKHKAMVEQVENPLEYDYSSGWTQTYEEFVGAANG
ncbi:DUF4376 domain-containing protein [[Pasteurella] aerogenes]